MVLARVRSTKLVRATGILFTTFALLLASGAAAGARSFDSSVTEAEKRQGFRNGVVLAKPRGALSPSQVVAAEHAEGRQVRRQFARLGNLCVIQLPPAEALDTALAALRASGRYEYVEPDFLRERHALPDDPRFVAGEQWSLHNTGQNGGTAGADIDAVSAWEVRTDASNVVVAVIDTGIRATHEDLAGSLWTNADEIPANGLDDDRNGYVDDVHGINSLAAADSAAGGDPADDFGHGTAVSGVIAAAGSNGKGIAGVAWQARIMALKFDDAEGLASISNEIECIDYALANGAQLINISYGSIGFSQAEYDALERARSAGVIVVTSAGNDGASNDLFPSYPANYLLDNLVRVAATDARDDLADFSNFGSGLVDLAAPGKDILLTWSANDTDYSSHNGTSFSAPIVTGALALLKAQFPTVDYRTLLNRLFRSVDPLPALDGKVQTGGRLNLARALRTDTDRPFNDDFATRARLAAVPVTLRTHNRHATKEADEPTHSSLTSGSSLWWSWTAPGSGTAVVETNGSTFDTVLAVYTGTELEDLVRVAANDDSGSAVTSRATFVASGGTTYHIAVSGKNDATGVVALTVGFAPANDQYSRATQLTGPSVRMIGSNALSSSEASEPSASTTARGRSVWYKWTPPVSGYYSVSVFAYGFDAVAAVYTGSVLQYLTKIETGSTEWINEAAVFEATVGRTYHFQIDSVDQTAGVFELALVDAVAFPGGFPKHSSAAYSPTSGYVTWSDIYGVVEALNPTTLDYRMEFLDGTLDVQSPALAGSGVSYLGDEFGYLAAAEPDLTRRWTKDLGLVRVTCSPAVGADGAVYVHTDDGQLHCYQADGTKRWTAAVPGESYSSPAIGADGTIYIGADDQQLYALAPADGVVKWKFKAEGEIYASPAIGEEGELYFGTLDGKFHCVTPAGELRWTYTAGGSISSSAALGPDGTVYFGCYDHHLYALTGTGALRWKYATGDEIRGSSPAVADDGSVYIGSYDGYVHAVNADGSKRRTYATGAYIRASPLIHDRALFIGSGDGRLYIIAVDANLAESPWPMHRQNVRRTGRRASAQAPVLASQPMSATAAANANLTLRVDAEGSGSLRFEWSKDGVVVTNASQPSFTIAAIDPAMTGIYSVTVSNEAGTGTSQAAIVGLSSTAKVTGAGREVGTDILHANGNIFDQVLLTGAAGAITADFALNQITRTSFLDRNGDIVQVEFSGPGTLSIVLEDSSQPAVAANYNQPAVEYVSGHARITIAGADERTNLSVFTVGRLTAVNQALFKDTVNYDGLADIAVIAISSPTGRFGGLRTSNTRYSAAHGHTGIYAPGVEFTGPVFLGDIVASASAQPVIMLGGLRGESRITGGDLFQENGAPVHVSGLTRLFFTPGSDSHGNQIAAQPNAAVLTQDGIDVTAKIVVHP